MTDCLGVHALLAAAGIARDAALAPGVDASRRELPEVELHTMLYRHPVFGPGDSRERILATDGCDLVLLPGSFDPCHEGHQMIADTVERQYGRQVAYAVTADPVHKPSLRAVDLLDRVASTRLVGGRGRRIVLTERDPLFIDKARQFPGAGIALGVDALIRMLDPSWGPNVREMLETFRSLGTRFYSHTVPSMSHHISQTERDDARPGTGRRSIARRQPRRRRSDEPWNGARGQATSRSAGFAPTAA